MEIHPDFIARSPVHREMQSWLGEYETLKDKVIALQQFEGVPGADIAVTLSLVTSQFADNGRIVYSMGPKLYQSLKDLKVTGVVDNEVCLPFEAFYLDFSRAESNIKIWGGPRTQWHDLTGAYVYKIPSGLAIDEHGNLLGEVLGIVFCAGANENSVDESDDAVYQIRIPMSELLSKDLMSYAKTRVDNSEIDTTADHLKPLDEAVFHKRTKELMKAFSLVINTILYVTSDDPDIGLDVRTQRRQDLEAKLFRAGKSKRGKISRSLEKTTTCYIQELAPILEASEDLVEGSGGVALHRVKAHFHRYWVGPTHEKYASSDIAHPEKDRRLVRVFVASYLRGTDTAGRVVKRTYKLKEG